MKLVKLITIGLVAGTILAALLKGLEQLTGEKVYTLLMNVDYIPVVQSWDLSATEDFLLHLLVSVWLVCMLYVYLKKFRHPLRLYISLNMLIGVLLYCTTVFSERTPDLTDMGAFSYWMIGHLIYGLIVGIMVKKIEG